MQGSMIDTGEWEAFWKRWGDTIDQLPGMKEQLLKQVGAQVAGKVRSAVGSTGVNDARGRVKSWQNPHLGSGRGYVATRSDSKKVPAGHLHRQELNAGALTNFLVSGHKIRYPAGRAKRYVPRLNVARVRGHDFYKQAKAEATRIALREAEDFLKGLQL